MRFLFSSVKSLNRFERILWLVSVTVIITSFVLTKNSDYLTLLASIIGATALLFLAKGNVLGQILTVLFSAIYGVISFKYRYFGEMITFLGLSAPVAIIAIITWLKNPYEGNKKEVKINSLKTKEYVFMFILGIFVTIMFYFILKAFNTNNLILSTLSIFTSFIPCYLTVRRSEFYALGYATNDIVLIILWIKATIDNLNYLSMVICFVIFLISDVYAFILWSKNKKRQTAKLC